ncbi:MAG: CopG family transcriptional regulator [Thermoprotei archaeon]|nr:MAG: CopG family transcriptional regulator [Thermoprotei archaeon]
MSEKVSINISKEIYEKAKKYVENSGGEFNSVEEFIEFVLKEVLEEEREEKQVYTPEEEEEIKRRLKSLGYL